MKKIFSILLCAILLFSIISCDKESPETSDGGSDEVQYEFISDKEKSTWRSSLENTLANIIIHDIANPDRSLAVGLMDINFDNIPEVLVAYKGGSMGNVFIEVYDLQTGEKLCGYNAPHWGTSDNIYLCIADKSGECVILTEGSFRSPDIGWIKTFGKLSKEIVSGGFLTSQSLFAESVSEEIEYYKCNGQTVGKAEYDAAYQNFLGEYRKIDTTQIQLIKWETIESENEQASKMAQALIESSQKFIKIKK